MTGVSTIAQPGLNYIDALSTPYGLSGQLPPELALRQQALNRRQQIANAMLQQATNLPKGQMAGQFYVPPSWAQNLAQLGEGAAGLVGTIANEKAQKQIGEESQSMLAKAVEDYKRQSGPQTVEAQGPGAPVQTATAGQGFTPEELAQPAGGRGSLKDATDALFAQRSPAYFQEGPRPTGAVPATPEARQSALIDLMANQHPQARALGTMLEGMQTKQEDRAAQQEFLKSEGALNRDARLQGQEIQLNQAMLLGLISKEQKDQMLALQKQQIQQTGELKRAEIDAKQEALQQGKTPPGYRHTPEGNLEAVPGGPADLKQQGVFNQDTSMLQSSNAAFDRLASSANTILNHPGLQGITGLRGRIPNMPGSQAADAEALLNTLKSQVGFGVLQEMRNNSKSGSSGLGAVSDAEGKRLENNLAALDKAQSLDQMKHGLQSIVDYANGAKDRLRDVYNMKHKQGAPEVTKPTAPTGGLTPAEQQELDQLKKKYGR